MYLIAGLGNPGAEYENTRHNLGFKVVDELAARLSITSLKLKHHSYIGEGKIGDHKVILAQPQSFMNNSGPAVLGLLSWYKIETRKLVIIYDDVDLEPGQIRVREKGAAGGHHGVESVIASVKTAEFTRVRIGIGRENLTGDVADYVLAPIPSSQRELFSAAVSAAAEAAETIVAAGITAAMNQFNGNP